MYDCKPCMILFPLCRDDREFLRLKGALVHARPTFERTLNRRLPPLRGRRVQTGCGRARHVNAGEPALTGVQREAPPSALSDIRR